MRTREKIEKEAEGFSHLGSTYVAFRLSPIMLEVLLDIRELLFQMSGRAALRGENI